MSFNIPIPKELAHLKVDDRGYPIPYFVTPSNGTPQFRFIQPERLKMIVDRKVCHVCGKKLPTDFFYFIAGPLGLKNKVTTDAAMHRVCAEFSLAACPHLHLQKATYRENDELGKTLKNNSINQFHVHEKPSELFLVKANKFKFIREGNNIYIQYWPVSQERYIYENNRLKKDAL